MSHPLIRALVNVFSTMETKQLTKDNPIAHEMPAGLTRTQKKLHEMLQENTGSHMLDSGGAYGRAWQHRRKIADFTKRPEMNLEVWDNSMTLTVDLFHFLDAFLEVNNDSEDLHAEFIAWTKDSEEHWGSDLEAFARHLTESGRDEGNSEYTQHGKTFNTYNFDNMLDGTIQGTWLTVDGDDYLALQIHGGCDVRGGYTDPYIFKAYPEYMDYGMTRATACCPHCGTCWDTDDSGYRWEDGEGQVDLRDEWHFDEAKGHILHKDCPGHERGGWKGLLRRFFTRDGVMVRQKPISFLASLSW